MDLGSENSSEPSSVPAVGQDGPKIIYPSLSLNDDAAETFLSEHPSKIGDEITATVTLKVSGMRQDEFGKNISFEVHSLDIQQGGATAEDEPAGGQDEDEDEEQEKILGYKRPTKYSTKESPSVSAKDLMD